MPSRDKVSNFTYDLSWDKSVEYTDIDIVQFAALEMSTLEEEEQIIEMTVGLGQRPTLITNVSGRELQLHIWRYPVWDDYGIDKLTTVEVMLSPVGYRNTRPLITSIPRYVKMKSSEQIHAIPVVPWDIASDMQLVPVIPAKKVDLLLTSDLHIRDRVVANCINNHGNLFGDSKFYE